LLNFCFGNDIFTLFAGGCELLYLIFLVIFLFFAATQLFKLQCFC